jgi:hypothetical protein
MNNFNKIIIENQYFACVNYYYTLLKCKYAEIEACEHYEKMSFRNRCVIAGANGLIHLSIPLEKGRSQRSLIKEVKINHTEPWQSHHWKSIKSAYGKAPFFEFYAESVHSLIKKPHVFLYDLNIEIFGWLVKNLKITTVVSETSQYQSAVMAGVEDCRNKWLPKNFQQESSIQYHQLFEEKNRFQPNLSILDFLFNAGNNLQAYASSKLV